MSTVKALIAVVLFQFPALSLAISCFGGPTPLKPFNALPQFQWFDHQIKTQDFNFWEDRQKVVFRNYANELQEYSLNSGMNTSLTKMERRMTKMTDPQNRYVATEGQNLVYDSLTATWKSFTGPKQPLRHMFWAANDLYTFSREVKSGKHSMKVHRYHFGKSSAEEICSLKINKDTKLAEGFHFPYFRLYRVEKDVIGKQKLYTYRMNVIEGCKYQEQHFGWTTWGGDIEKLYHFDSPKSVGLKIKNSSKDFLWIKGDVCLGYDIPGNNPIVIDYKNPTIASWTQQEGLQLRDLESERVMDIAKDWNVAEFNDRDIHLSKSKEDLLVSPLLEGSNERSLVHIKLQR